MSVYIRPDAKDAVYSYDFKLGGRRFSGSTGKTARPEALRVEKAKREEARAALATEKALDGAELTVAEASAKYWNEVGQHHANARTTMWSLDWIERHFGGSTMLHAIGDAQVASMVARRRGEFVPDRRRKKPKNDTRIPRRVSAATVNRTVTQPLREVILRAARVWKVRVQDIDWSNHLLPEPQERVREARRDEESAIMGELERGYDEAVAFAFLTGCRRMEILGLVWTRVDFFNRQFSVLGKAGKLRVIPMSQAIFDLLWRQQGHHAERVFTFVAKRTVRHNERKLVRGERYPLTEAGLKTAMRRGVARAGVADFHFHDTRHTAATRVLRKSNLRVVQKLLGHADIATTTKYAHAMQEDVRDALEALSAEPEHATSPAPRRRNGG